MTNAVKLLPFAFAIHNFEELWAIWKYGSLEDIHPFSVAPIQFAVAVLLFTLLGFALVFAKGLYKTSENYQYAITGFAGTLFLNSFFPHVASVIYFGTYMPGIITAILLILPLTTLILYRTYKAEIFSKKQFILTILLGGFVGLILVFLFLAIGSLFA
jgi:hypothetical protein